MAEKPNLLVILADTLRSADVGCYGSREVRTPSIDAFARRALRFTRAAPESLPTVAVRRALHSGRRSFPFRDYRPLPWDIVNMPGWQPLDRDEDTLAENLAAAGYQTGLVTDNLVYFSPGFNFTRGFWQWEFVRGQQQDRWQSPYAVSAERLARYGHTEDLRQQPHSLVPMHLANTAHVRSESDTTTAKLYQWAMQFLEDNRRGQPFYLVVDGFAPHEPWDAPDAYYKLYGDPNYAGRRIVHCAYAPADQAGYSAAEIAFVRAHYRGLVTLMDTWLGKLLALLDTLGLAENTAVFVMSDHGTNFCDNPRNVIGKPENAMYPGVMQTPLLARLPGEPCAGGVCDELVYNLDLTASLYDLAGIRSTQGVYGQSLVPLVTGASGWRARPYLTSRYGNSVWYTDKQLWAMGNIDGIAQEVFDLTRDPTCQRPLPHAEAQAGWAVAWPRILADAGGVLPDYRVPARTDAIGEKPVA